MYTPVVAQVVQSYTTDGTIAASTAKGTVYLHFVKLDATGTVGGTPVRAIGSGEQIRTFPLGGQSPDGGVSDGSGRLATLKSGANQNVMDWSLLLAGVLQSDGSTAPAGKYQAATKNFYAASGFEAIYGVSGGGPAFMYDGIKTSTTGTTVPGNFTRILTGLALDQETPRSVATHQGHLYLGYYSGIVQQSNLDNVLYFDPSLGLGGAQGYGMSDRVTGMATVNGDTLAVWTQKSVQVIQGQVNVGNAV